MGSFGVLNAPCHFAGHNSKAPPPPTSVNSGNPFTSQLLICYLPDLMEFSPCTHGLLNIECTLKEILWRFLYSFLLRILLHNFQSPEPWTLISGFVSSTQWNHCALLRIPLPAMQSSACVSMKKAGAITEAASCIF